MNNPGKDWQLKCEIEKVLREHPSYGHRRLALHLCVNKKRTLRVMKLFGIKPYRRRARIHTALKMPPQSFVLRYAMTEFLIASNVF